MALAKTHDLVNLTALPLFLYLIPKEFYLPFAAGYVFGTFFLSPDIDLPGSRPSKRWSVLRCIWTPYQTLSRHRGISHLPLIGSFLRLIYLICALIFLYFTLLGVVATLDRSLGYVLSSFNPFELLHSFFTSGASLYVVAGIVAADVVHVIFDMLWSVFRRVI